MKKSVMPISIGWILGMRSTANNCCHSPWRGCDSIHFYQWKARVRELNYAVLKILIDYLLKSMRSPAAFLTTKTSKASKKQIK